MADINSYGIRNDGRYEYGDVANHESLNPRQLHDLAMFYLTKTAYEGITPEQLVDEYLLAVEHISDHVHVLHGSSYEQEFKPYAHTLEDGISGPMQ